MSTEVLLISRYFGSAAMAPLATQALHALPQALRAMPAKLMPTGGELA